MLNSEREPMDESGKTFEVVLLSPKDAVVQGIDKDVLKEHFGATADISSDTVEIRVGLGPILQDLTELSKLNSKPLSPELQDLGLRFRLLLLTTSASVIRTGGGKKVTDLQFEVIFPDRAEVIVIDTLPKPSYIERASARLKSDLEVKAGVKLDGSLDILTGTSSPIGLSAGVKMSNEAGYLVNFDYKMRTPSVQVVGKYDKFTLWKLSDAEEPIGGDYIFVQTLLVDKTLEDLAFDIRVRATMSKMLFLSEVRKTRAIPFSCDLSALKVARAS
jgi:hypothetical protein